MSSTARCRRAAREKAALNSGSPWAAAPNGAEERGMVCRRPAEPGAARATRMSEDADQARASARRRRFARRSTRACSIAIPPIPACPKRTASTIPRSTRIPAASASSPTSRAASRTRSSRTRSPSWCNLEHRGAVGADPRAGDGAGILVQIPHKFFARKAKALGITLPDARRVRHRRAVHAARRRAARARPQDLRAGRGAGRPDHPRLAHRHADRQFDARRDGEADRALPHAGFHWKGKKKAHRGRVRAPALHPAQVDLGRRSIGSTSGGCRAITRCRSPAAP